MLKNKCSVWKRIKFPTFWYNCYYFTWSDTYFIQLETLLINQPSYLYAGIFFPYTHLRAYFYNWYGLFSSDIWTESLYTLGYMSAFETENKLSRSLNLTAVNNEIFQLTRPATVCGTNSILSLTYFTKPELTEVLWTQ